MPSLMPKDAAGETIPVLGFMPGAGAHSVSVTASSARNSVAFDADTRVVTIYATVGCHIEQGAAAVVSTTSRHFIPAGAYLDIDVGGGGQPGHRYIAVIKASGESDGMLYISERV